MVQINLVFCQEQTPERFVYESHGRRDPFLSLVSPQGYILNFGIDIEASDLKIEGIIYDPNGESVAIVNGVVVKVGDYIGNFKIIDIASNKVVFIRNEEEVIEIQLKKEE
jgi:hypothetical protein